MMTRQLVCKLEVTTNHEVIKKIITNPILWEVVYGNHQDKNKFQVDESFNYFLVLEEQTIVGLFQIRDFTKVVCEAHIYLLPMYWGTGQSVRAVKALIQYIKEYTTYTTLFTDVPESCVHVHNLMKKVQAKECGVITKGVIHNQTLQNLHLYQYEILRS